MEVIKRNLEDGEQVLWTGHSVSKILDKTYSGTYFLRTAISIALMAALMVYAAGKTDGLKPSVFLILLLFGAIVPLAAYSDGRSARKLMYAVTNRRLVRANGESISSIRFDEIGKCSMREDADGQTSLLCGKKTVSSGPSSWRGKALYNGPVDHDEDGKVNDYVFYAVNDPEGMKKALDGKVTVSA